MISCTRASFPSSSLSVLQLVFDLVTGMFAANDVAEACRVVAGAASLTVVMVEKAIKLKNLLENIKDAPVRIVRIKRELQILADTISALDDIYRREPDLATSELNGHVTSICRASLYDLHTLLSKLNKNFKCRLARSWASFKAALKRDEIGDSSQRLGDALQLLQIVN